MVNACVRTNNFRKAESWFGVMREHGVEPDVVTYTTVLSAYARSGEIDKAEALVEQMRTSGIVRFFLYRSGRTVFAFQERDRPFASTKAPASETTARWWREMAPLMETEGADHQPVHRELREVFALDTTMEART